jgi:hypothetical protein
MSVEGNLIQAFTMTTIVNWKEQTSMIHLQYYIMAMGCAADVLDEMQSQNDL